MISGCATQIPVAGKLIRAKAYPGPERLEKDIAVIFATDGRPRWEATFICTVNGRPLERQGCANVIYLTPGSHTLGLEYRDYNKTGKGELPVVVEAGRLYQLNASSLGGSRGLMQLIPMTAGVKLTYRNVSPSNIPVGSQADDIVPYGSN
jgi:hypothetical protein